MTTTYPGIGWSPIGAYELKSSYQRNLRKSALLVLSAFVMVFATIALIRILTSPEAVFKIPERVIHIAQLGPPPSVAPRVQQVKVSTEAAKPNFNLPVAISDPLVFEDPVILSRYELAQITPMVFGDGNGSMNVIVDTGIIDEYLPDTGVFVPRQEEPVVLSEVVPKYPEIARKAGIEGEVYLELLIDTKGRVRDARVIKDSGANAGFEEAALEAVKTMILRPAMQNNQPVAVRVGYTVKFRLR